MDVGCGVVSAHTAVTIPLEKSSERVDRQIFDSKDCFTDRDMKSNFRVVVGELRECCWIWRRSFVQQSPCMVDKATFSPPTNRLRITLPETY